MVKIKPTWPLNLLALLTASFGVLTLSSTLFAVIHLREARLAIADAHFTVIVGVSLIYLAGVLRRGKRNAWLISLPIYAFILIRNFRHFVFDDEINVAYFWEVLSNLVLPALILIGLVVFKNYFQVKSETRAFGVAVRRALIILLVAFLYGVIGFQLFDHKDFRQEIPPLTAAHYTIDQFGLTTGNYPQTYTKRAVFFVDSLASISIVSLAYVAVAFFAPIRFRLTRHQADFDLATAIINKSAKTSEDFFKLWPCDKSYFFNDKKDSLIAYRAEKGVAMSVGDPLGSVGSARQLVADFKNFCTINDWRVAFIHTDSTNLKLYKSLGLESQKIGEEALVDINRFTTEVMNNKYFRNINNRFTKQGYSFEIVEPPHDSQLINTLSSISEDWLSRPGRSERGFMLGYFAPNYIEQCRIALIRDVDGNIKAFLNQVPTCKGGEANYDFLRHSSDSLPNINDFLMLNFIKNLQAEGYQRLNMGLCPLSGLDEAESQDPTLVNNVLRFAYSKAGRFYSFEGLKRFKAKYSPDWEPRYIIYSGGPAGFGRTLNALLKAMSRVPKG